MAGQTPHAVRVVHVDCSDWRSKSKAISSFYRQTGVKSAGNNLDALSDVLHGGFSDTLVRAAWPGRAPSVWRVGSSHIPQAHSHGTFLSTPPCTSGCPIQYAAYPHNGLAP